MLVIPYGSSTSGAARSGDETPDRTADTQFFGGQSCIYIFAHETVGR